MLPLSLEYKWLAICDDDRRSLYSTAFPTSFQSQFPPYKLRFRCLALSAPRPFLACHPCEESYLTWVTDKELAAAALMDITPRRLVAAHSLPTRIALGDIVHIHKL